MYLMICVLDDTSHLEAVLEAWTKAGIPGVTILESTGVQRVQQRACREDIPLFMGFSRLLRTDQYCHNTLLAVVENMEVVHEAVAATEAIIGDLSRPHTGIICALPVEAVWGVPKQASTTSLE